ncbi:hypothetical protein DPMN_145822 [Dreissena polymorpha]|uniref:Uncharacterized protein n=1 Tax=Dreissena polymorpha TaxID=45954 RepID=A0A9D4F7H0_DREPO|nr:hypothetical protein DPMN_145822 [Dreissena polymorpha]
MPVAFNATTANAAMPNIRTVSDEIAAHIPDQLKQQIERGEYVNFALLLKRSVELQSHLSGAILSVSADGRLVAQPKECKDTIGTIAKWSDAFIIFMSVYLSSITTEQTEQNTRIAQVFLDHKRGRISPGLVGLAHL